MAARTSSRIIKSEIQTVLPYLASLWAQRFYNERQNNRDKIRQQILGKAFRQRKSERAL